MGQAKRKSKKGFRDLTRTEREHAQFCLHEASHAVIAIMTGIPVLFLAVCKDKPGSPAYREWFDRIHRDQDQNHLSLEDFYAVNGFVPGAFVQIHSSCIKTLEQLAKDDPKAPAGGIEYLAHTYAPQIVERRTPWTNKMLIASHFMGDNATIKRILEDFPEFTERLALLKGKTNWEALLEHYLSFKHVSQSIEVVGRAAEQTNFLDAETLLTLVLTETERVINVARETDDFFVDSAQGCAVPFERVKAEVLDMALGSSKRLLSLLNTLTEITDMDLITRHDKWLQEYEELMRNNGPTIFFNLLGADS